MFVIFQPGVTLTILSQPSATMKASRRFQLLLKYVNGLYWAATTCWVVHPIESIAHVCTR